MKQLNTVGQKIADQIKEKCMLIGTKTEDGETENIEEVIEKNLYSNNQEEFADAKIDDILIHSTTFDEHIQHLTRVLDSCKRRNARLKMAKCKFARSKVLFLGIIISEEGISPDSKKVESIVNIKSPKNVKEVRSFLGDNTLKTSLQLFILLMLY